jgi:hypothetical protein
MTQRTYLSGGIEHFVVKDPNGICDTTKRRILQSSFVVNSDKKFGYWMPRSGILLSAKMYDLVTPTRTTQETATALLNHPIANWNEEEIAFLKEKATVAVVVSNQSEKQQSAVAALLSTPASVEPVVDPAIAAETQKAMLAALKKKVANKKQNKKQQSVESVAVVVAEMPAPIVQTEDDAAETTGVLVE